MDRTEVVVNTVAMPRRAFLWVFAAGAWTAVAVIAVRMTMASMHGTMTLGIVPFSAVWALMMTAMMLPSVTPFVALYERRRPARSNAHTAALLGGYLAVWAATAVPAYGLAVVADHVVSANRAAATSLGCSIFVVCGLYQLTSLKDRCLVQCRSPLGLVLRYAGVRGRTADFRIGVRHGAYCVGCCWALMTLLVAFGVMNLWAMVGLSAIVYIEKTSTGGRLFTRALGVAALGCAAAALFSTAVAPGLRPTLAMKGM